MTNLKVNNSLAPSRGFEWYKEAFALFEKAPFQILALPILALMSSFAFSYIPVLGFFLQIAVSAIFNYGACQVLAHLDKTSRFEWPLLFAPFSKKAFSILIFWLICLIPYIIGAIAVAGIIGFAAWQNPEPLERGFQDIIAGKIWEGVLEYLSFISLFNYILIAVTMFFMAVLATSMQLFGSYIIVLSDARPTAAAKLSIKGTFSNMGAMTIAGLIAFATLIAAIIPLGIGLLFYFPFISLVTYRAYTEVFSADPELGPTPNALQSQ